MGILEGALPQYAVFTKIDAVVNWARTNSLSVLTADLACCGVEMLQLMGGRFDFERFGAVPTVTPNDADLLIVAGSVSYKIAPKLRDLFEQMPNPRFVISVGSCANTGGMFSWEYSYSTVSGVDKILPVDVYVPGCPPRPEAILDGVLMLQKRIRSSKVLVRDDLNVRE